MKNDELDFNRTHRRAPLPVGQASLVKTTSCVVCGLRADVLICKECALRTESSIAWLETLPASERVTKALGILRGMG